MTEEEVKERIKKIRVVMTGSINIGNYENLKPESGIVEAEVRKGDDPDEVYAALEKLAIKYYEQSCRKLLEQVKKRRELWNDTDKLSATDRSLSQ